MQQQQKKADTSLLGMGEMMNEMAGAVARQVKTHILPEIRADQNLQRNLARGLGEGLGDKLSPAAMIAATGLLLIAGCYAYKTFGNRRKS